uniref:Vesicle-fusing ATPase n=1 Tax=Florenciella parvula TaxID=236787 RepID=A0A7S2CV29_9STRA
MTSLPLEQQIQVAPYRLPASSALESMALSVNCRKAPTDGKPRQVDCDGLITEFMKKFSAQVFVVGQELVVKFDKQLWNLKVLNLGFASFENNVGAAEDMGDNKGRGQLLSATAIELEKEVGAMVQLSSEKTKAKTIFNKDFDFSKMGIGGLDDEFNQIFRRAFASRIFPSHIIEQMGIHHVRGMLLYGPPGCGKTLIARKIGNVLNAREPKIVNGPEILDKFVGGSEQKIRDLFADAEAEQKAEGDNSMLHIVIFDEFDAICKSRGSSSDSTGVSDSIVNQLLSKIDGVDSLNNILIIGMTNRKDMIDDAILRPGRLEVHVEIGLPTEKGRLQILNIHTASMRDAKTRRITDEAEGQMPELAARTKNFSGAELSGLVRSAAACALGRAVKTEDMSVDPDAVCCTWSDFEHALTEIQPKFGAPTEDLEALVTNGIVEYGPSFAEIQTTLTRCVEQIRTSERTPLLSVLLEGDPLTGKTAIAANLAIKSGFPFVRFISADALIGMGEMSKCSYIQKVFMDSYKSPLSMILIDDIERIIDYTPLGPRFSNMVLQTLLVLLKKAPPKNKRLFIVGTTSIAHLLEDLQLVSTFHLSINVAKLQNKDECRAVLQEVVQMPLADLDAVCAEITKPLAVKQLLMLAEMARSEDDTIAATRFMECLHTMDLKDA